MRVLSVRQPWAWAIIYAGKDVENRGRNVAGDYHGPVAIHASLQFDHSAFTSATWRAVASQAEFQYGAIIGVVDLEGAHHADECHRRRSADLCSDWAEPHQIHLELTNPRAIPAIPYRGSLGLTELRQPITDQILTALGTPRIRHTNAGFGVIHTPDRKSNRSKT